MINKAILVGRIGKMENKAIRNGGELTTLSLATTRKWKDSSGDKQEATTWHRVNCFGNLASVSSKYAKVGDLIYIEGEIQNSKSESDDKWYYSVTASSLKLLSPKIKDSPDSTNESNDIELDDDIPF